jgi:hypothetical protein
MTLKIERYSEGCGTTVQLIGRIQVEHKVRYMQFMEDTFCTASSFRSGGAWKFQSDPNDGEAGAYHFCGLWDCSNRGKVIPGFAV